MNFTLFPCLVKISTTNRSRTFVFITHTLAMNKCIKFSLASSLPLSLLLSFTYNSSSSIASVVNYLLMINFMGLTLNISSIQK